MEITPIGAFGVLILGIAFVFLLCAVALSGRASREVRRDRERTLKQLHEHRPGTAARYHKGRAMASKDKTIQR